MTTRPFMLVFAGGHYTTRDDDSPFIEIYDSIIGGFQVLDKAREAYPDKEIIQACVATEYTQTDIVKVGITEEMALDIRAIYKKRGEVPLPFQRAYNHMIKITKNFALNRYFYNECLEYNEHEKTMKLETKCKKEELVSDWFEAGCPAKWDGSCP
jgi:hypothetical protein